MDDFKPAWWVRNKHIQTLLPRIAKPKFNMPLTNERLELPDGDFLDLVWAGRSLPTKPIVVVLHGLAGTLNSPYAKGIINQIVQNNWRALFMYFRGAGPEPNRLPRYYHSGDTRDFDYLIQELKRRQPHAPICVVGYSLGGNVLLKWLGEKGSRAEVSGAVAISVPYDLTITANAIDKGFSKFYQWYLLRELKRHVMLKFKDKPMPFDLDELKKCRTFWDFDEIVTAPLHGFYSAQDYYHKSSSKPYLKNITVPTLLIHAADDPFMSTDVIPRPHELSQHVTLYVSPNGGHVGFIDGSAQQSWLPVRITRFIETLL